MAKTHTYTYVVVHEGTAPTVGARSVINGGKLVGVGFYDALAKLEQLEDMIAEIKHTDDLYEVRDIIKEYEAKD